MPNTESATLGYVKALVWPAFVLFAVLAFWTPLHRTADLLPRLFANSESLSAGSFTLKVSKGMASKFSSDDLEKVNKLSADAVRAILSTNDDRSASFVPFHNNQTEAMQPWQELEQIGLVRKLSKDEIETAGKNDGAQYDTGFYLKDQYWRVRELLVEAVVQTVVGQSTNVTAESAKGQTPSAKPKK